MTEEEQTGNNTMVNFPIILFWEDDRAQNNSIQSFKRQHLYLAASSEEAGIEVVWWELGLREESESDFYAK